MFRGDTRGQSVQVGVIILLAFAVIGFSSYQAVVVPQQNQEVEFDHSREVQQDIVDTRNAIVRAANAGQNGAASIQLGQDFPARIFALNAPTASGRFATTDRGDITVTNSDGDVCPGPDKTVRASYTPSYSYYNNAPTTKYENTFVFSEFDDGTERVQTRARLLFGEDDGPGGTVNLVALFGETRQSGTEAVSLDLYSGTSDTESITGPNVTLPTSAKASTWAEALGYDSVDAVTNTDGVKDLSVLDGEVTIELVGEYDVVCTEVGMDATPPNGLSDIAPIPSGGNGGGGSETALPSGKVAYNDANRNGQYDDDDETAYSQDDFDASADPADFSGEDIIVERSISVEKMEVEANSFTASGVLLESTKNNDLSIKTSDSGPIDISGSTVSSEKKILINGKSVRAVNSDITAGGKFTLTSNREADLSDSNIDIGNEQIVIKTGENVEGNDLNLEDATLVSDKKMKFSAQSAEVLFNSDEDDPDKGTILETSDGGVGTYSIKTDSSRGEPEKGEEA
ncbi:hypothetical protein BRD16_09355 [Halobacteriales archaeon SW_6_65_46]|nr:MAG: hypothetical protein BRD16_09355 [Halobacteriales archaeon SW_6_65_46]